MVPTEPNPINKTQTKKEVIKPETMTKGEIGEWGRGLWNYMRKQHKLEDLYIATMKPAKCPAKVNNMEATIIRLFDSDTAKERGITVEDYESLNKHPELILYEGYQILGRRSEIILKRREGDGLSFLEEKIKDKSITEVGVVMPRTTAQQILSGFGNFMVMGGFLIVVIGGFVIVLLITVLAQSC